MRNIRIVAYFWALIAGGMVSLTQNVFAQDYDALIQQALLARDAGELQRSESLLRQAQPLAADQTEVRYLLAMVVAFQQRFQQAHELIDEALRQAPEDVTLRLGKARIYSYQANYRSAGVLINGVLNEEPDNTEALELAAQIVRYQMGGEQSWTNELLLGTASSRFDRQGMQNWQDRSLSYARQLNSNHRLYATLSDRRRFGSEDSSYSVGWMGGQQGRLPWHLAVTRSPDENFSAASQLMAAVTVRISNTDGGVGTTLITPNVRWSDYSSGQVVRAGLDFEHYIQGTNVWVTPGFGWVRDENDDVTFSWVLSGHWQASDALRLGAGFADGAETENKITTETESYFAYARWQFNEQWFVTFNAARDKRQRSYSRSTYGLTLGLWY